MLSSELFRLSPVFEDAGDVCGGGERTIAFTDLVIESHYVIRIVLLLNELDCEGFIGGEPRYFRYRLRVIEFLQKYNADRLLRLLAGTVASRTVTQTADATELFVLGAVLDPDVCCEAAVKRWTSIEGYWDTEPSISILDSLIYDDWLLIPSPYLYALTRALDSARVSGNVSEYFEEEMNKLKEKQSKAKAA